MVPNHAKQNISFFHKSLFCGKFVKSLSKIDKLDIIIPNSNQNSNQKYWKLTNAKNTQLHYVSEKCTLRVWKKTGWVPFDENLQTYLWWQSAIRRIIDYLRFFIIKPFLSNIQFFKNIFNVPLSTYGWTSGLLKSPICPVQTSIHL